MSSNTFSNTNTGDKPEDPYKAKNLDTTSTTKEKIDDLAKFMDSCKFGMMTTRDSTTSYLHSRCMALAAKVLICLPACLPAHVLTNISRHCYELGYSRGRESSQTKTLT